MKSIDILIPTYNRGYLLNSVVENILQQNYNNMKIIISDNCSTDNTQKIGSILSSKYNNVYYFRNTQNLGIYGNYNYALEHYCKSEYVLILSDDDFFIDFNYIKKSMEYIEKENLVWIGAGYNIVNTFTNKIKSFYRDSNFLGTGKEFLKIHKFGLDNFSWFTIIFNRTEALKVKFDTKLRNADYLTIFNIAFNKKIMILNDIVGVYTLNNFQSNHNVNEKHVFDGYKLYIELKNNYKEKYCDEIFIKNVKSYICSCFKFLMDKDAVFNLINFNDEYWIDHFKNLNNGLFYPFFDNETDKRYSIYKTNKTLFKKSRLKEMEKNWNEIRNEYIKEYIKVFDETNN
ncbi:glycosyltransferase family 2 protein [Hydrogenimonas thermophila]|uniref:Glycosyl transferase family 2 n=1 Tax=Hydrogenimonas thermophila TaxID=223786 RepID=A0A1I5L3T6_9BACT|nr:glycosyltransferase family 2 protein [Hydrogenimonas thermophila]SFO91858.1 Glycosyl transferase family 2 [Hydrogenimonas thermophila]